MDADEDDFVFYGTPIEREEEMTSRKKKAIAEASGNLRALPAWKQEVTDEEGRRRFHGAFTGGFSAGYYNTVGSKEGWTPQSFTSSRKKRAEVKEQSLYNFLDDDEKTELEGRGFGTSSLFDTFGFTAAEVARRQAEKEVNKRPSAIPGPVPDELIAPSADSIGVKLLLKMGWRHGRAIKDSQSTSLYDARREARKAFLAFSSDTSRPVEDDADAIKLASDCATEQDSGDFRAMFSQNTPVFVPKQDLYGLGYDPFRHAPEFRERKRLRASKNKGPGSAVSGRKKLFSSNSGKVAPGFGIGALEELDVEDEDIYASGFEFEETYVDEVEEPTRTMTAKQLQLTEKKHGGISGFKLASNSDHQIERFNPPVIPPDFEPHHKFPAPLVVGEKFAETPPPVPPPEDNNLRLLIEGFATLVTRCGKLFEDLSREKNKTNPLFSFLTGGSGHEYYARKLWEEQQKQIAHKHQIDDKSILPSVAKKKLTAETRGRILGEKPLERSAKELFTSANGVHLQLNNLSDTFTTPSSLVGLPEAVKPFKDDPAKQERFEQFLKDKYQGGLRSTKTGGANMSEADRARERLDFEAAAEAIQKGKQPIEIESTLKGQFVSGGLVQLSIPNIQEKLPDIKYPRREEYQWRPSPLLCKRFDLNDPFMGQPLPLQRARRRIDSLIFASDFPLTTSNAETVADRDVTPVSHVEESHKEVSGKEAEISDNPSVERPVDLYKAIFSDDSDDEDIVPNFKQEDNLEIKNEIANSTLNRLIAGDFLETLGKELGLEVPPDPLYYRTDKTNTSSYQKEAYVTPVSQKLSKNDQSNVICQGSEDFSRDVDGNWHNKESKSDVAETASSRHSETKCDKFTREGRVTVIDTSNEKKKRQDSRSSSFESDSSSDSGNRNRSRFREDKRDPLRKSSSKHSKHREHKHKRSRSRSRRHRSDREDSGNKREKTKSRTDKSRLRDDRSKSDPRKKQHH